ncbi:CpsD/CapB family tyrosine-protein kinase [Pararobbsia silviterrae]|uniref:Polysaccharide biosynthesis tyrosine autokinase n=1 Tax=Pararobbsia silviterrae TaxID=1792498 RepID=A0A494XSK8_9BURK|nr:CpsD/CapB family tyrosine-protein kinase [Pararobbsia silviterrae]RKP53597.1 polysaccharide biosynthesis tyrosine autokinase [Pararobbsia silviterrae]
MNDVLEHRQLGEQDGQSIERMGDRFVRAGLLTREQVQRVIELQNSRNLRFGQAAVQLGFVSEQMVSAVLAEQYQYDVSTLTRPVELPLAIASEPFGQEAEAVRQLRTMVSMRMAEQRHFSLAVISPGAGAGSTYLASSLAVAFAQVGRKTLLVNADLHKGGQRELMGKPLANGLSGMLAGRHEVGAVRTVPGIASLGILDAGPQPPNPAELLRDASLQRVLGGYMDQFEIFIVKTPPTNESGDALLIARQVDACLLVARKDRTRTSELEQTAALLGGANVKLLGTVYNEYEPPEARTGWLRGWLPTRQRKR